MTGSATRTIRTPASTSATTSSATATDRRRPAPRKGPALRTLAAAVLVAAVALLAGCGYEDDPYLFALRADPIASYAPPGTDVDVSIEQARKDPSSTTKGQQAKILRSFRTDDPATAMAAIDDPVAEAQDAGWQLESRNEQGATFSRPGPASDVAAHRRTSTTEPTVVAMSMTAG